MANKFDIAISYNERDEEISYYNAETGNNYSIATFEWRRNHKARFHAEFVEVSTSYEGGYKVVRFVRKSTIRRQVEAFMAEPQPSHKVKKQTLWTSPRGKLNGQIEMTLAGAEWQLSYSNIAQGYKRVTKVVGTRKALGGAKFERVLVEDFDRVYTEFQAEVQGGDSDDQSYDDVYNNGVYDIANQ
jgi:hypothetical protein